MANEYLENGDFSDNLTHWTAPVGFEPDFKPKGEGQSIKLNTGVTVSQSIIELPAQRLHLEFDVLNAEDVDDVFFVVVVGGYNIKDEINLTQVVNFATQEWVHYSGDFDFQVQLRKCFLNISAPAETSSFSPSGLTKASPFGPVRYGTVRQPQPVHDRRQRRRRDRLIAGSSALPRVTGGRARRPQCAGCACSSSPLSVASRRCSSVGSLMRYQATYNAGRNSRVSNVAMMMPPIMA
ncbi:hypothetical protein ALQ55_05078 [Pseudomonas savastanoi pv. savastanoi]|nr:hypothetical protein ALQ55_05078 [Pseudomonas savastanoi pv. savastanoi]